jgi:hypothetical protein
MTDLMAERAQLPAALAARADQLEVDFAAEFGQRPQLLVRVPGRVNLIGKHIFSHAMCMFTNRRTAVGTHCLKNYIPADSHHDSSVCIFWDIYIFETVQVPSNNWEDRNLVNHICSCTDLKVSPSLPQSEKLVRYIPLPTIVVTGLRKPYTNTE